ncbi:hypothetical protein FOMPIDRAFT_141736 [Fomitopsis schrenkii]|uniref:RING-type domain-containing protein n=1 Tax=Fomitopsis schrenkii TaxID=2126942 RepID=S8FKK2_FOMSC|nr:hypothetical protein FOMPIDRAFT_141736 [Fomitopsis schrenkii]
MTKHSKNNTASSIFSYAEYKKLDYGTRRQRLGNESMRRFDACTLCLQRAREPVTCQKGHLFCKECVYTDLVTQLDDIKRQKARLEAMKREAEEERQRAREAARERVLLEFEKGQLGLASTPSFATSGAASKESRGTKRKFEFDESTVETLAREAEEAALRQIEREQAEALKHKLPDFWLPSLTPTYSSSGPPTSLTDVKIQTACHGGTPAHPLARKNLIPVNFIWEQKAPPKSIESTPAAGNEEEPKQNLEDDKVALCPSCKKTLSNSNLMYLMKPCGHVVCKTCTDKLVKPGKQCIHCDVKLAEKDIIQLTREGTGYAAGGLAETSKKGIAFQG